MQLYSCFWEDVFPLFFTSTLIRRKDAWKKPIDPISFLVMTYHPFSHIMVQARVPILCGYNETMTSEKQDEKEDETSTGMSSWISIISWVGEKLSQKSTSMEYEVFYFPNTYWTEKAATKFFWEREVLSSSALLIWCALVFRLPLADCVVQGQLSPLLKREQSWL